MDQNSANFVIASFSDYLRLTMNIHFARIGLAASSHQFVRLSMIMENARTAGITVFTIFTN
jgi:hypothetical protein